MIILRKRDLFAPSLHLEWIKIFIIVLSYPFKGTNTTFLSEKCLIVKKFAVELSSFRQGSYFICSVIKPHFGEVSLYVLMSILHKKYYPFKIKCIKPHRWVTLKFNQITGSKKELLMFLQGMLNCDSQCDISAQLPLWYLLEKWLFQQNKLSIRNIIYCDCGEGLVIVFFSS